MDKTKLGKALRANLILARGNRTQAEFARFLGIKNQQTYQRYENGQVPTGVALWQIAERLGVPVGSLLEFPNTESQGKTHTRNLVFELVEELNSMKNRLQNFASKIAISTVQH